MVDAREIARNLRLPARDEQEVERIGSEVVAGIRDPKFDGTPVPVIIPAGEDAEQQARSFRIARAIQRRFQARGWLVAYEQAQGDLGEPVHKLWIILDGTILRMTDGAVEAKPSPIRLVVPEATAPVAPSVPLNPILSILFGTYNRIEHLQRAVASIRRAVGILPYEMVVTDGGSTDGSREWLAKQPDVVLIGERRLEGAVRAFNQAYALSRGTFIANLNDDCDVAEDALVRAVSHLQEHPEVGQVALGISGEGEEDWKTNDVYGPETTYANFGVVRREVAEKVAYITGGFWNPLYETYAADVELSAWVWRLGYEVASRPDLRVRDTRAADGLRERNEKRYGADTRRMYARWPKEVWKPGPEQPCVTDDEMVRYLEVRDGVWEPPVAPAAEDALTVMAGLCGLPEPGEERRLRQIAPRVRALDPVEGRFPERAERLSAERVLYVSLATEADPQAGLDRALRKFGPLTEVRWFAKYKDDAEARRKAILDAAHALRPTLVFMQLLPGAVDADTVRAIRDVADPTCVVVTWSGDVASYESPWKLDDQVPLGRAVDLVLHSSLSHVHALRGAGVHCAGFLGIGYDELQYHPLVGVDVLGCGPNADFVKYDVCFLGSRYGRGDDFSRTFKWKNGQPAHDAALRDDVVSKMQQAFGARFGLFGTGWGGRAEAVPLARAHEVLWRSRIGLNVSLANRLACYTSDRLFRILGCGALLLTKRFPMMSVLGLKHGENCFVFDTAEEAVQLTRAALVGFEGVAAQGAATARDELVQAGARLARENHTWDVRMLELQKYVSSVREVHHDRK